MITKELIENRWKLVGGLVLASLTAVLSFVFYELFKDSTDPSMRAGLALVAGNYEAAAWQANFSPLSNRGPVLLFLAALLGATFVAGEVGRGTIFVLLSRPLDRDRILLTKYAVGAGILGLVVLVSSLVMLAVTAALGHPQPVGGVLVSSLLFWLGSLFVLGVAGLFSVLSGDVLRPLVLAVVVLVAASLPALFPGGSAWVLPGYWTSLPAYLGQAFPARELLVSLGAAAVPIVLAVGLFRRQQY